VTARAVPPAALGIALAAAALTSAAPAHADLREAAARVRDQWRAAGAAVTDAAPRFLYEDETATLRLDASAALRCTTVAMIGPRGLSFHAKIEGGDASEEDDSERSTSVAGILAVSRCDGRPVDRVIVTSDAGRGALEVVIARSSSPLPSLRSIFPERTGTMLPPSPDPGALPALPPPAKRADAAEARARADGARVAPRVEWQPGDDGAGAGDLELEPGCHRIEVFAPDPRTRAMGSGRRPRLDLDAELRDADDDSLLARDRTEAADAHLQTCVGGVTLGNVVFAGATPSEAVIVTRASWPIADRLPRLWGSEPRARMAAALLSRHITALDGEPVLLVQGASGVTPVGVPLERGACYVAIVALTHGAPRGLGMRAVVGATDAIDARGMNEEASVVAFCARAHDRARIEVEARGSSLAWGLAVFRTATEVWAP